MFLRLPYKIRGWESKTLVQPMGMILAVVEGWA
jgi:hypothetical protein